MQPDSRKPHRSVRKRYLRSEQRMDDNPMIPGDYL